MSGLGNNEFQAYAGRMEQMVQRVSALEGEAARSAALDLLQSTMDLHGAVLSRIVELLDGSESGRASLAKLGSDPLVCGMLVLYGVHPVALEDRVARAVESVRPQLRKQGGSVELLAINDAAVRLKIESSGHGCHSTVDALKATVEQAIFETAPEIAEVIAEGAPVSGFVPLNVLQPAAREEKRYEESAA